MDILTDPETLLTERIQVPSLHDSHSVYDDRGRLIEAHTGDRVTTYSYSASGTLASIPALAG